MMALLHLHRTYNYQRQLLRDLQRGNSYRRSIVFRTLSSLPPTPPSTNHTKEQQNDTPPDNDTTPTTPLPNNKSNSSKQGYANAISDLSKAKLSALVVSTTSFGFLAAGTTPTCYLTLAAASLGTALCSSCASCLNQIIEQDRDARMKRTKNRPLVTKAVIGTPGALVLACTTSTTGAATLWYGTDAITTALGVGNIALYAGAYTYLKPRSEWNTWVGAVVGAVPPVMGYTAATHGTGLMDIEALLLGTTLFLWQFPHFMALGWMYRVDYARGGFEMVGTNDSPRGDATARLITNYTWYLSAVPFVSTLTGVTSSMFAIEGLVLNGYALYVAKNFDKDRSNGNARKVFLTSLWYLPCWMVLFLLHSKNWKYNDDSTETKDVDDDIVFYLKKRASEIRNIGKELCVHEVAYDDAKKSGTCPVVIGKSKAQHVETTIDNVVGSSSNKNNR